MIDWCDKHGAYTAPGANSPGEVPCPKCQAELPPPAESVVQRFGGLDLAKEHDYSAMVDADVSYHKFKVRGVKMWPHVDYMAVIGDVAARFKATEMRLLAFDETGVGEPVKEMLWRAGVRAEGIKFSEVVDWQNPWGEKEHAPVKYAMIELARAAMQNNFVDLPTKGAAAQELAVQMAEQELVTGQAGKTQDVKAKYAHPQGRHDDLLWAFCMALYISRRFLLGTGGWFAPASQLAALKKTGEAATPNGTR